MPAPATSEKIRLTVQARFRAVGNEGVLVHLESGRVIVVNEVGLFIIEQLKVARTCQDLASAIASEFDISQQQAESDLGAFVAELDQEQILDRPQ